MSQPQFDLDTSKPLQRPVIGCQTCEDKGYVEVGPSQTTKAKHQPCACRPLELKQFRNAAEPFRLAWYNGPLSS
jgi:hypothetical protein